MCTLNCVFLKWTRDNVPVHEHMCTCCSGTFEANIWLNFVFVVELAEDYGGRENKLHQWFQMITDGGRKKKKQTLATVASPTSLKSCLNHHMLLEMEKFIKGKGKSRLFLLISKKPSGETVWQKDFFQLPFKLFFKKCTSICSFPIFTPAPRWPDYRTTCTSISSSIFSWTWLFPQRHQSLSAYQF